MYLFASGRLVWCQFYRGCTLSWFRAGWLSIVEIMTIGMHAKCLKMVAPAACAHCCFERDWLMFVKLRLKLMFLSLKGINKIRVNVIQRRYQHPASISVINKYQMGKTAVPLNLHYWYTCIHNSQPKIFLLILLASKWSNPWQLTACYSGPKS